jgi:hypothetical protein
MKKCIFVLALLLFTGSVKLNAQDVIAKIDGSEIRAKVIEIGATEIKYKLFDEQDGPAYTVLKSDIFRIKYASGRTEVFNANPNVPVTNQQPLLAGALVKAQDVIIKRDGSEIIAKITVVTPSEVKYKLYNDLNGPDYVIRKKDVFKIKYSDGTEDGPFTTTTTEEQPVTPTPPPPPPTNTKQTRPPFDSPNSGGGVQQGNYTPVTPSASPAPYRRRGYVGMAIGGAFPTKDSEYAGTGIQFCVNAGYLFAKNIGITSSFLANSYEAKKFTDTRVGLSGALIGPLISFGSESGIVEFDIRPTVGFLTIEVTGDNKWSSDDTALALGLGWSVRWNLSKYISLSGNLDYMNQGEFDDTNWLLSAISSTFGVNFRF